MNLCLLSPFKHFEVKEGFDRDAKGASNFAKFCNRMEAIKTYICFPDFKISHIPKPHNGILNSLTKIARSFHREFCYIG